MLPLPCCRSKHPAAELHAAARVLSGGSVYVSDAPGQHNVALLRRLVLPDGTILRALRPGRPTRDTIFRDVLRDGESLLKVRQPKPPAHAICNLRQELASRDLVQCCWSARSSLSMTQMYSSTKLCL